MVATSRDEYKGKGTYVERRAAIHKTNTKGLLPSNGRMHGYWVLGNSPSEGQKLMITVLSSY